MKCLECGKEFDPLSVNQKYCCEACGRKYRRHHEVEFPIVEFYCAHCGKHVITDGKTDKRTRFCSAAYEKKYWKHPHYEKCSSPKASLHFPSVKAYLQYEKRTNEE